MKNHRILAIYLVGLFAISSPSHAAPLVLAGGVAGVEALADAANSAEFRTAGGGLYLHNNGWAKLTPTQQTATLEHFKKTPVALELGFAPGGRAKGWADRLKSGYLDQGIRPLFIAANAFASNNQPTADQWKAYTAMLRGVGLPESTLVLPTFEYANFAPNIPTLSERTVSKTPVFQEIIHSAGGIVLDTPSGYFFGREENYRQWVKDAIEWTRKDGGKVVVILSPHKSGNEFAAHTRKYLQWMRDHSVMADWLVVENYNAKPAADYANVVGHEKNENTAIGCALMTVRWFERK